MKITYESWRGNVSELSLGQAIEVALEPDDSDYSYNDVGGLAMIATKRQTAMLKVLIEAFVEHQSAEVRCEFVKSLLGYGFKVEP